MMTNRTPASLALLDRLETTAEQLLGGPVLPTRAKGVRYMAETPWHADSDDGAVKSVGFAAYLEPLGADSGALRVLPASHRQGFADELRRASVAGLPAGELPGHVVCTDPGDIVVFDEHLLHASAGGNPRRQWRVDFVLDLRDAAGEARLQAYFARIFPPDWDGGYDVDEHPSYGADWLASGRRAALRLQQLGVYDLAARQEAFTRAASRGT
jgi:hypothetical protein